LTSRSRGFFSPSWSAGWIIGSKALAHLIDENRILRVSCVGGAFGSPTMNGVGSSSAGIRAANS
jgi:hypothetical protein